MRIGTKNPNQFISLGCRLAQNRATVPAYNAYFKTSMHNIDLILTLTGGLAAALVFGYITHLCKLSPIVGYLIAGVAVGRHTPGFIANQHLAEQLAEVGVILLMFGVGLHFHLSELLAVRKIAIPGAIGQSCVATVLGAVCMRMFGWDWTAGIVFGLAIAVASTVVLTRILADNRELHTTTGHVAIGWLIVEDLMTVFVLVVLPTLADKSGSTSLVFAAGTATLKISILMGFVLYVGGKVIPWLLTHIARSNSRELFTLTTLVLALGISVGAMKIFDVSMALGAFLAGMVVGRSEFSSRAASEAIPMRDAFAVLFFVSVGMLLDPMTLINQPVLILCTLGIVIVGKALAAIAIVLALGYPVKVALGVGVALAQIGEFSFIVATSGKQLGLLPPLAMDLLVATAILSITLNPIFYRLVVPLDKWIGKHPRLSTLLSFGRRKNTDLFESSGASFGEGHRAVIIGYGPVGQTVVRLLRENGVSPTVIEMNVETARRIQTDGIRAVHGDATRREVLEEAGVEGAGNLIISSSSVAAPEEVIRNAKDINADIFIVARTSYVRELSALKAAGAQLVFSGEGEVALALAETLLRELGATPDQIENERERVRQSFLTHSPNSLAASGEPSPFPNKTLQSGL